MNIESLLPFAIIITPFAISFLLEALVLYFSKLRRPGAALGISIVSNLVSLGLFFYVAIPLLGQLGYDFNGLRLPLQVVIFYWWFSTVTDGILLRFFMRNIRGEKVFAVSAVMNALSTLFWYVFIINSH